jgi:hypothetical protein
MKKKPKNTQLLLISIGIFLILGTYFYYPYMNKNKHQKDQAERKNLNQTNDSSSSTTFEKVEYEGLTAAMQKFSIKSENAFILDKEPNLVHMKKMRVNLYLNDGRMVTIVSDHGRYDKQTHDCWFKKNVVASDEEIKIFAENLDLLATENFVRIYEQVRLFHTTGSLQADQINYDFETKNFKVSMFEDNSVKMKIVQ